MSDGWSVVTESKEIYSFQKSRIETVKVRLMTYHGRKVFDIRAFTEKLDGSFMPTKKGMMLDIKHLYQLEKIVDTLRKEISENSQTDSEKLSRI